MGTFATFFGKALSVVGGEYFKSGSSENVIYGICVYVAVIKILIALTSYA